MSNSFSKLALGCCFLFGMTVMSAHSNSAETGFLDRSVSVNGVPHKYQVFVPEGWTKSQAWPVIVFLHGTGESGDDGMAQTDGGIG